MAPYEEKKVLDEEFIKILRLMKPYITCIMNNHYIELVRQWLEKLSDTNFKDKTLRNQYLVELGRQIEAGIFEGPFVEPPPESDLPPYSVYREKSRDNVENEKCYLQYDIEDRFNRVEKDFQDIQKQFPKVPKLDLNFSDSVENPLVTGEDVCNFKQECSMRRIQMDKVNNSAEKVCNQIYFAKPLPLYENMMSRHSYSTPVISTEQKRQQLEAETSSWYDLTETALETPAQSTESRNIVAGNQGDYNQVQTQKYYEDRISNLLRVIDEIKHENIMLKEKMEQCQRDLNLRNTKAETSIHKLIGEVSALKQRFQELIKTSTQQTNLTSECHTNLQNKLQETLKKNLELRSLIIILEKKFTELVNTKSNKTSTIKKKMQAVHAKEVESLKKKNANTLQEMQNALTEQFQNEVANLKAEYDKEIKYKNEEIVRLEHLMRDQCQRMQNEVKIIKSDLARENVTTAENAINEQKVMYLQKCIIKLEKLFNKSEKEYLKQITKLKYEVELKERATKLALSKQKAELLLNNSTDHQKELDEIVNTLEEHYRDLLRKHQEQAMNDHLRDAEIIAQLQKELQAKIQ